MNANASVEAWSAYWRSGALHSLDTSARVDASALLLDWVGWFDALPEAACVADLACGNGLLAGLALGFHGTRHDPLRRVYGIDIAELAPHWIGEIDPDRRRQLVWLQCTPIEAIPELEGGFDAFCSQFGFEYAEPEAAVDALSRVAAAGARLQFLVHHSDSLFARQGAAELEALRRLLAPAGLFDTALRIAENLAARYRGTPLGEDAERVRLDYNRLQAELDRLGRERPELLALLGEARAAVHAALVHASQTGDVAWLSQQRAAFDFALLRLENLLRVACSEARITALLARFEAKGWRMAAADPLRQQASGALLGWRIEGCFHPDCDSTTAMKDGTDR